MPSVVDNAEMSKIFKSMVKTICCQLVQMVEVRKYGAGEYITSAHSTGKVKVNSVRLLTIALEYQEYQYMRCIAVQAFILLPS